MKVAFDGLQEILQRLGNLPIEEDDENRAVNKAANIVKKAVQEEVTANGWSFENEIKTKRAKDGEAKVHSGKAYQAHILEGGRSAGSKYALKNGKRQKVTWGPIAPNPFFTRGFEKSKAEAMKTMEDEVKEGVGAMIDIIKHVEDTLTPLNLLVSFQKLPDGITIPSQYITFLEIIANPDLEAGDVELETKRLIQINIWSKSNYHSLVEQVKKLMEEADYERTFEHDMPYNDGDSHFNKVLRFVFFDEY